MVQGVGLPRALTIAGSDSGGGAGIQADLKTFFALGVYGMSAITALTAQNTLGVQGVHEVPAEMVAQQIDAVATDIGVDAAKTGMLASAAIVEAVADRVRAHGLRQLVVDPVMVAKSGDPLLSADAVQAVRRLLLPVALVLTPNLPEAARLTGLAVEGPEAMREAARRLHAMGARYVVVKGGHLHHRRDESVDLVYDGSAFVELAGPRFDTPHTHGTGCTFSAAIAAYLARGLDPVEAIRQAKEFVSRAIQAAVPLGAGHGPTHHWAGADLDGPGWEMSRVARA
ncbi:MAG: bifunctional hydroxymethylpyrimidine kinase/phosphomethylpyrimidine kinase [Firmicutes bacterium]|uniref:Hydroxymethylpyrimidine/phosphomethylpyrimidine kinase n=1 Tax=Geochorda subterranea TaxID=3109564 RepID=A0ABZ1BNA1_9FIRM|nr:bifunctional hydroxymethylpyrimidine kinase/phosphomethylpyrimidine kinase [Limnochorda sp. LNt]NLG69957.1 bifunctional hydroxymethylpyrimidine kinase/phosphomethylpyrimidine kinase [Bacillota bacterium]WRP14277.1 bifunctional hydroxymethylpyrimidine kinase/phosphomethylpyrimidine kinase [Limnochorda sp. LNt]